MNENLQVPFYEHYLHYILINQQGMSKGKDHDLIQAPPPAYHEVIEDAFDEEPNNVERSPSEERREDLVGGERPQVGLESQDDDAANVSFKGHKMSKLIP